MKRCVVAIIAVVTLTMLIAGCSKKEGEAGGGKKVLTAMFLGSTHDVAIVEIIRQMTEKFNAENTFNAEFKYETYENEQYKTKLATLMASNSAPDVFFTWSVGYLKPFVEGGKVYEIGKNLNSDPEWKGRFNEGVFGPVTYNGKIYAVPHGQTVAVMYYNTRLFKENGISVPASFNELKAACAQFKAAGIIPISVPVKDAWIAGQFLQQLANGVSGLPLFNGTVDGNRKWNDPDYIKAGELLVELVNLGSFPPGYLGMTHDEGRELFAQEKAAMYYMGSWDIGMFSDSNVPVSKNVGVFNMPSSNPSAGNAAVGDVDMCFAISANCPNPEAAAAYIKLFSGGNAQEAFAYNANYLLSTKTPLDQAKLSSLVLQVNAIQQTLDGATPWFDRVFGAGEGVEFNNAAQAIIAGKSPSENMNKLQQFAVDNAAR